MKKYFLIITCLAFSQYANAQDSYSVNKSLFKINILAPGFTYERGVSKNSTVCLDANLSLGFVIRRNETSFPVTPFLRGQYRYYYNLDRRILKGKDVSNNSGNFVGLSTSHYFNPLGSKNYVSNYDGVTVGGIWGFQKTYKSNLNLSANAGLGYNFSNNVNSQIVPILNFTVAWVFLK
jgi:hypothetical protein